jgi:hypothetical protein
MASTIREQLAALADPIPFALPGEYVAFVEALEGGGGYFRHAGREWWVASISRLQAPVRTDLMGLTLPTTPYARYLVALVSSLRQQWPENAVECRDGSRFELDRLGNGFWIGEDDGDSVFLDQQSLGVYVYIQDSFCVERWAESFRELLAAGG